MSASFHVLPCSIEDCIMEALIVNHGTCTDLYKTDQRISPVEVGNWYKIRKQKEHNEERNI